MFNFCHYNKCLRKSAYPEKRSILVHRLRSFSPGLTDSIPLGLWRIMWWGWTVYFMRQSEQGAVVPSVTTLEGAPQRPKVHLQAFYLLNISLLPSISSLGIKLLLHRLFGETSRCNFYCSTNYQSRESRALSIRYSQVQTQTLCVLGKPMSQ